MKGEVAVVAAFLKGLARFHGKIPSEQLDRFEETLTTILMEKFRDHWYPEEPNRGQAYRCIRINLFNKMDMDLFRACSESGIRYTELGLPEELTVWADPGAVHCRYGENNPSFYIASIAGEEINEEELAMSVAAALERVTYNELMASNEQSLNAGFYVDESGALGFLPTPPKHNWIPQVMQPVPFPLCWIPGHCVEICYGYSYGLAHHHHAFGYRCNTSKLAVQWGNAYWFPPTWKIEPGYWEMGRQRGQYYN